VIFITHDLEEAIALPTGSWCCRRPDTHPIGNFRIECASARRLGKFRMNHAFHRRDREIWSTMKKKVLKAYARQKVA